MKKNTNFSLDQKRNESVAYKTQIAEYSADMDLVKAASELIASEPDYNLSVERLMKILIHVPNDVLYQFTCTTTIKNPCWLIKNL